MKTKLIAIVALFLTAVTVIGLTLPVSAADTGGPGAYQDVSVTTQPFVDRAAPGGLVNCPAGQLAVWWVNNQERNPYGELDSSIYYEFPAGTRLSRDNVGLHTVKIEGEWRAAYCVEPGIKDATDYTTEKMTMDQWMASQYISSHLTQAQMQAMGVVLLYGQVDLPQDGMYQELSRMLATQILIWEIATGERDPYSPFRRYDDTFIRRFTDEGVGVLVTSYFLHIPDGTRVKGVVEEYNKIAAKVQDHYKVPSFTSPRKTQAPTIELKPDGKGNYVAKIQDKNGILSQFKFQNTKDLTFARSGNTLTITAKHPITETLITTTKSIPSAKNQVYYVLHNGSYQQMAACAAEPVHDPLPAFFKVSTPTGNVNIKKTTEDGKNLAGWKFHIYADEKCTKPVSGPHVSDAAGTIGVKDLQPGIYWVKEIGHTDPKISEKYVCDGENPRRVTVKAGQTAEVIFYNRLLRGSVLIRKKTSTGRDLGGWKIGLYSDILCRTPVPGSPFVTQEDGTILVPDLKTGIYYAREIDESAQYPYWQFDTERKRVTVHADQTASVTFVNTQLGDLRIIKNAVNGSPEGWSFQLLDSHKKLLETLQTDPDGYAFSGKLEPGIYYVREIHDRDETYWEYDAKVEKAVTVEAGNQAQVVYTNTQYGRMEFRKTTNTSNNLDNWVFEVLNENKKPVGTYRTDATGYACTEKLAPGRYYVKEVSSDDPYWSCDVTTHTLDVTAGKTVGDSWTNIVCGKGVVHKMTNTGENLQGWEITFYRDEACMDEAAKGVTGSDGSLELYLEPGIYYARETGSNVFGPDDPYWKLDASVCTLEIRPHEDTEIVFSNTHFGQIGIIKKMSTEGTVAGWKFKITDADGREVEGSPFTTDEDGRLHTGNLLPGTYTVEELIPANSPYYCQSENPQKVRLVAGTTAEVTFCNALRPGSLSILKVDLQDKPLAGARFLLEWSRDGEMWAPISYIDGPGPNLGGCSNADVVDGCLVSGEDGVVEWSDLHPALMYRVTEVAAPDGYSLLTGPVFEGMLSEDTGTVSLRVVNTRIFEMPRTGGSGFVGMGVKMGLCAVLFGAALCHKKKE